MNSKNKIKPTIAYLPSFLVGKSINLGEYAVLKTNYENIKIVIKITGKNNNTCYSAIFSTGNYFSILVSNLFLRGQNFYWLFKMRNKY